MKKRIIFTNFIYTIKGIILLLFLFVSILFLFLASIQGKNNSTLSYLYVINTLSLLGFLFTLWAVGKYLIQWVIIDERKIIARNLFGVISDIRWDEIEKVQIDTYTSFGYKIFNIKWLVFIDTKNRKSTGYGINYPNSFIKIKYNKKTIQIIKDYIPEKLPLDINR
jgi:hypothetical protein